MNNDDAEGVYFSGTETLVKSDSKVNYFEYSQDIVKSRFVLTHQRIATSGRNSKMHQPFMSENLVLMHNGIMSNFEEKGKSDTYVMFNLLRKSFIKYLKKKEDRTAALVHAINDVFDEKSGSFSVVIFDRKDRRLFYFKNSTTNIHFYMFDDFMMFNTVDYAKLLDKYNYKPIKNIKDNKIYTIDFDDIVEVGEIKPAKNVVYKWGGKDGWSYKSLKSLYDEELVKNDAKSEKNRLLGDFAPRDVCKVCGKYADIDTFNGALGMYTCSHCKDAAWSEWYDY
jgi:predicted glutamine amidotransferase